MPRSLGQVPGRLVRARQRPLLAIAIAIAATSLLLFTPVVRGASATRAWASSPRPVESLAVVRQQGRFDCGPALLSTLARWGGREVSLASVLGAADIGESGVTLGEFARLAAGLGLHGTWYRVPRARLRSLHQPFVAHLDAGNGLGHYVAVVALEHGLAGVADPARGGVVGGARRLLGGYTGRAFLFEDRLEPGWVDL